MFIARQIHEAIGAHGAIKLQLAEAIASGDAGERTDCGFGIADCALAAWLNAEDLHEEVSSSASFAAIRQLHDEFHRTADAVQREVADGRTDSARTLLRNEFAARSRSLVLALMRWRDELSGLGLLDDTSHTAPEKSLNFHFVEPKQLETA